MTDTTNDETPVNSVVAEDSNEAEEQDKQKIYNCEK
jgi:hypothetical protein